MAAPCSSPPSAISSNSPLSFKSSRRRSIQVVAMAKKKVNRYDDKWKKEWYGAGIFFESDQDVKVDVFKKLEKGKVLSGVEKAGLLSKAEGLGLTLSSVEKLGLFSKAEELGLLSLLENVATVSPAVLASISLPLFLASLATILIVPDDSTALIVVQYALAAVFGAGGAGLFIGSFVLDGLQQSE